MLGVDAASTYGGGAEGCCHAVRLRSRLSVKWTCLFIDYLILEHGAASAKERSMLQHAGCHRLLFIGQSVD
jgi:hypothetical protein